MKKLFKRALLFIAIYLAIATPLDILISREMRMTVNISGENEVWNDIYDKKINDPCLIYGSSRAKTHIDPAIIERETGVSAYNFGSNGQPFVINKVRHDVNLRINGRPQYIIHSADYSGFSVPGELFDYPQFYPYMLWDWDMIKGLNIVEEGFSLLDYFVPLARYYGELGRIHETLQQAINPNPFKQREKGYTAVYREWTTDFEKAKEKNEYVRGEVNSKAVKIYEDFIEECQSNGTRLAIVFTPEYIEGQEYVVNHDSIVAVYDQISKKYNIPFFDYTKDSICYDKKYFYNSMHLNAKGSILITEQLTRDLNAINFFKK